jgi:hypothetical protein
MGGGPGAAAAAAAGGADQPRPMTSVRAAGYSSIGKRSDAKVLDLKQGLTRVAVTPQQFTYA